SATAHASKAVPADWNNTLDDWSPQPVMAPLITVLQQPASTNHLQASLSAAGGQPVGNPILVTNLSSNSRLFGPVRLSPLAQSGSAGAVGSHTQILSVSFQPQILALTAPKAISAGG